MVAEGAPNLPIHPRPNADPLSHLNGLLSADVRQLGHAVLVVYVAGELDMLTGPPLQDHLDELLATRPDRLIIDLSQVSFMGSTGLSVLICTRQNAVAMGTTLQLSGTSARAISVPLEVTGLNRLFEILPTPPTTGDAGR
ncbi:MAG: STAS domain-containing protein [Pseudonocardiaceae bacterium]